MKKWNTRLKKWFADVADIPEDLLTGVPRLTLIGQFRLSIENYKSVRSFSATELRLSVDKGELRILGKHFVLETILKDEIVLQGKVSTVQFMDS